MVDPEIQQYVQQQITQAAAKAQISVPKVPYHTHNNIDSPTLPLTSTEAGVSSIIAGTNVTITPTDGTGVVTVNASLSSAVSSVTGSGSGINVSPTTGAVVVSNTGVTSLVAGTNITLSGSTGAVTITATGGGTGSISTVSGTDSTSGTTPATTTHTITHGLGKRPTTITLSVPPVVASAPSGSGVNGQEAQGWFTVDTNGNGIAGMDVVYTHVFGGGGTLTLTGGGILTNSITGTQTSSGGTGTAVITLNNVTTATFDIVYAWTGSTGQSFSSPTVTWTVLG